MHIVSLKYKNRVEVEQRDRVEYDDWQFFDFNTTHKYKAGK